MNIFHLVYMTKSNRILTVNISKAPWGRNLKYNNMWLNKLKGTSCWQTRFWVTGVQSQNISKNGPKINFEISYILESSHFNTYSLYWLKGLYKIGTFMQIWTFELLVTPLLCPNFQTLRAFSSKSTFTKRYKWMTLEKSHIFGTLSQSSRDHLHFLSWSLCILYPMYLEEVLLNTSYPLWMSWYEAALCIQITNKYYTLL